MGAHIQFCHKTVTAQTTSGEHPSEYLVSALSSQCGRTGRCEYKKPKHCRRHQSRQESLGLGLYVKTLSHGLSK